MVRTNSKESGSIDKMLKNLLKEYGGKTPSIEEVREITARATKKSKETLSQAVSKIRNGSK